MPVLIMRQKLSARLYLYPVRSDSGVYDSAAIAGLI